MPSTAEDRDEILQLMYRYSHTFDGGDAQAWADTFTDGGSLDAAGHLVCGREELVAFASSVSGLRHVVANAVIDIAGGDTARVQAYLLVFKGTALTMIGTYDDTVVRTSAGWRFATRAFTIDPTT